MSSMPPSTAPDTSVCPLQQSKDSGGPWAGRQRGSQLEENSPHRAGEQEQQAARAFLRARKRVTVPGVAAGQGLGPRLRARPPG